MIIRNSEAEQALCITQLEHSIMTGELAKRWSPEFGHPLKIPDAAFRAALVHDFGWMDWEAMPENDTNTGHPYDFLNMPKKEHLRIWGNGFTDTGALDPLVGLLVLRHNMTLAGKDEDISDPVSEKLHRFKSGMMKEDAKLEQYLLETKPELSPGELKRMNEFILLTDYISLRMLLGVNRPNPFGAPPVFDGHRFALEHDLQRKETMRLSPWPFQGGSFNWTTKAWKHKTNERFETLPTSSYKEIQLTLLPTNSSWPN